MTYRGRNKLRKSCCGCTGRCGHIDCLDCFGAEWFAGVTAAPDINMPEWCQLCSNTLTDRVMAGSGREAVVDAKLDFTRGRWAAVCKWCFINHRGSLGDGWGQLIIRKDDRRYAALLKAQVRRDDDAGLLDDF